MGTDAKFSHLSLRTNQELQETFRLSLGFSVPRFDIPLEREIGYKGWIHLKIKKANQREANSGKINVDIKLIDAMQRKHAIHFKRKSDKDWDKNFYIGPKVK